MALKPRPLSPISDTVAAFAPAITAPRAWPAPPAPWLLLQRAAAALTKWQPLRTAATAEQPEFTSVYAVLRNFTPESTIAHLKNGTADSQNPAQEYLLKYLRQHRQLKLKAVNQRVLQIDIPRWEDGDAIRRRLGTFHERAIVHLLDVPVRPKDRTPQGTEPTARQVARM